MTNKDKTASCAVPQIGFLPFFMVIPQGCRGSINVGGVSGFHNIAYDSVLVLPETNERIAFRSKKDLNIYKKLMGLK